MKYILEYYEDEITKDMISQMRELNQNILSIKPLAAFREFTGYSFLMYSNSEDRAKMYLEKVGAVLDTFEKVWKVGY